jgi:hypothetical protein
MILWTIMRVWNWKSTSIPTEIPANHVPSMIRSKNKHIWGSVMSNCG